MDKFDIVKKASVPASAHMPRRRNEHVSVPASAHMPRRRNDNVHAPAASQNPRRRYEHRRFGESSNTSLSRSSSNLRKARFKALLPTIEETDSEAEEAPPTSSECDAHESESKDHNLESNHHNLSTSNATDKPSKNSRRKWNRTPRRAITSFFEKRPTRSALTLPPPIQSSSFVRISNSEEILVAQRRPFVVYDLLPPKAKSSSFLLRFDTDIPRPRLILTHRTFFKRYEELSLSDTQEMVMVALNFLSIMNLPDCSLIIPLGKNNKCDTLFNTFYAYINVPSVYNFIRVFDQLKKAIPLWPSIRWVTSYWNKDFSKNSVEKSYLQTVRDYHHQWNDIEVPLMEFKDQVISVSRRTMSNFSTFSECPNAADDIVICEKANRVGFVIGNDIYDEKPELRWHFLELMFRCVEDYVKDRQNGCYMFLSLAKCFLLPTDNKVYGFLQFDDKIPDFLRKQ